MKCPFKKDEIIWAKLKGFPWWPGKINTLKNVLSDNPKILVEFFGDQTIFPVSITKIKNYKENYQLFSKSKRTTLQRAIALANKDQQTQVVEPVIQEIKSKESSLLNKINAVINNPWKISTRESAVFSMQNIINSLNKTEISLDILKALTKLFVFLNKKKYSSLSLKIKGIISKERAHFKTEEIEDIMKDPALAKYQNLFDNNEEEEEHHSLQGEKNTTRDINLIDCINIRNNGEEELNEVHTMSIGNPQKESSVFSSTKTDEEDKISVKLRPLTRSQLSFLLRDYFSSDSYEDFIVDIKQRTSSRLTSTNVKKHYLRKTVCSKLKKVLTILMKDLEEITNQNIDQIVISIELKGREIDNDMSRSYKHFIQEFYDKLKNMLLYN